jgi:hypothetical protein
LVAACADRVVSLCEEILACGCWTVPVVVDEPSLAIIDGYSRVAVANQIGLAVIPALALLFDDPRVRTHSNCAGMDRSPSELRNHAAEGRLLQPGEIRFRLGT